MTDFPRPFDDPATPTQRESALNPREFVAIVRRRWWVVAAVVLVAIGLGFWHITRQTPIYRASTTVRIQEQQTPLSTTQGMPVRDFRVDFIQSEQTVIRSMEIANRVADELGLRLRIVEPRVWRSAVFGRIAPVVDSVAPADRYELQFGTDTYSLHRGGARLAAAPYGYELSGPGITFTVPRRPSIDAERVNLEVVPLEDAGAQVLAGISTRRVPETNVVEILYTAADPEYVKLTADAITREYEAFSQEVRRAQATARANATLSSMREQELRLKAAQHSLRNFKQREGVTDIAAEQAAMIISVNELERQRADRQVELSVYSAIVGQLAEASTATEELRKLAATPAVQSNTYLANLYDNWFELSTKRQNLLMSTREPWSAEVRSLDSLIADTKDEIRLASAHYLTGLQSQLSSIGAQIARHRGEMSKYPQLEAESATLDADVKMAQGIYETLLAEYQRAIISQNSEEGYVRRIDEARWPIAPIAPRKKLVLMTAAILGLMLGLGAAVGMERLDDTIKAPDELRDRFGLGVLGTIPGIKALQATRSKTGANQGRLVTHLDPRSPVAESYRSLRTNLAFSRAHAPPRSIVFTSPGPSDGKSTTVANLAITFAQQGQRTLVIDADLRRAVLDTLFDVPRSPGLTDVLVGRDTLRSAAKTTQIENLSVLGSGPFPSNPSELLGSTAMRDLLQAATEEFDMVLLDSPPLLAVTDAAVLSTMADAAVLVVRRGATTRGAVRRASSQLQTVRGHLVGAVLNDVNFGSGLYYDGYGYYYQAYYGSDANGHNAETGVVNRLKSFVARTPSKH